MYQGVANSSDIVGECWHGCVGDRQRLILCFIFIEEIHQRCSEFCLTASLRAKGIEERKGTTLADDDVPEECGDIEAQPHLGVVAKNLHYLGKEV